MAKTICQIQHSKKNRSRENDDNYGEGLYKLKNKYCIW